jgi:GNAT superfamily N-acetyltransferase
VTKELVGFGILWRIEEEAHIISLAVDPEHRRQGLGRRMPLGYSGSEGFQSSGNPPVRIGRVSTAGTSQGVLQRRRCAGVLEETDLEGYQL